MPVFDDYPTFILSTQTVDEADTGVSWSLYRDRFDINLWRRWKWKKSSYKARILIIALQNVIIFVLLSRSRTAEIL